MDYRNKKSYKFLVALIIILATIFTLLPIGFLVYSFINEDSFEHTELKNDKNGNVIVSKDVVISDERGFYNEKDSSYYVQGILKNKTNSNLESVSIDYEIYDNDDNLIGTATSSIEKVSKNTNWKFKAVYSEIDSNEATNFKIVKVSFY